MKNLSNWKAVFPVTSVIVVSYTLLVFRNILNEILFAYFLFALSFKHTQFLMYSNLVVCFCTLLYFFFYIL